MALRVLHTSDWHLGHVFHGVEREPEHRAFLRWLLDLLAAEAVDALLIAGDVFDAANPPASATALWYGFLAQVHARLPALQVVVIGGNHDSAGRLEAPRPLLDHIGPVHVVGGLGRSNGSVDLERTLVPLHDRDGRVAAWVLAMPFLRPADLPLAEDAADPLVEGTRALYGSAFAALEQRRSPGQAVIAMGHCYLAGSQLCELSERKVLGGNQHPLPADLFAASSACYVALGHLHTPQRVGGQGHVRYSGAVLPLSFDERHPLSVVLLDCDGAAARDIRTIPIPRTVDVLSLPTAGPAPLDELLGQLRALPARGAGPEHLRPLLEVRVALAEPEPRLRKLIEDAVAGKEARLVRIAPPLFTGNGVGLEACALPTLADLTPEQVFRLRYGQLHEGEPGAELLAAFHELCDGIGQEDA